MERIVIKSQIEAPSLPPTSFSVLQPPVFQSHQSFDVDTKISPNILLIIVILAVIFFISGLVHLMVRFLVIANNRDPDETENDVTALQGQLQQLFVLHDAGVDQSFIDALPIFHYKSILGVKDPFDCAVCLCEFEHEDYLRLLPKCSHAFHMECIDTWLLSHSTCPLCRASLLADFSSPQAACNPALCILESDRDSSREVAINGSDPGSANDGDLGCEISLKLEEGVEKIVTVKLGKFKSVADGSGESSNNKNVNSRRCFSMGSVAYVMDETTSLQVPIIGTLAGSIKKKTGAVSEYGSDSKRELKEINIESFSISKVWPRSMDCSKRVFSYRFGGRRRTICDVNEETQSYYSGESHHQPMASAATGTTLRWLLSKHQNKFTQSSSSSNV